MTCTDKPRSTVSVVMATCNGARFLRQQLDSIAAQSMLPDELIVGDDLSADASVKIIQEFARQNPRIDVRLETNTYRLGSTANFEAAVRRCRGDIIIFSDQDDQWLPQRIERLTSVLTQESRASYAFSDGMLMDEAGQALGSSLFSSLDFSPRERHRFSTGQALQVLMRRNVVTGATLAVRRGALNALLPFEPGWVHDYYIAIALATLAHGVLVDEPLIRYRLHGGQQIGVARASFAAALAYARKQDEAQCLAEAEKFENIGRRLASWGVPVSHEVFALLRAKVEFNRMRARMRARPVGAPLLIARALLRNWYQQYSLGWKQVLVDLLAVAVA